MNYCHRHGTREAVATCVGCGQFICDECRALVDDKNYCPSCTPLQTEAQKSMRCPNCQSDQTATLQTHNEKRQQAKPEERDLQGGLIAALVLLFAGVVVASLWNLVCGLIGIDGLVIPYPVYIVFFAMIIPLVVVLAVIATKQKRIMICEKCGHRFKCP